MMFRRRVSQRETCSDFSVEAAAARNQSLRSGDLEGRKALDGHSCPLVLHSLLLA